jgi:hypothetical protein
MPCKLNDKLGLPRLKVYNLRVPWKIRFKYGNHVMGSKRPVSGIDG